MYMAPEVFRGEIYSEKIDVFSDGVIVAELFKMQPMMAKLWYERDVATIEAYAERVAGGYREMLPSWWPEVRWRGWGRGGSHLGRDEWGLDLNPSLICSLYGSTVLL